ncbi:copper resistance D family protein [Algimonas ampicilliniresistens]|nr:CopD family protein [Algimonas ampicilliniresistens]
MTGSLVISAKVLFYLGSLFGIGAGTHYAVWIVPSRRWLWVGAASALLAISFRLLGLNLEMVGDPVRIFDFSMFGWVWPGVRDQVFALVLGAGILAIASLMRLRFVAFIGALCVAHGFGLSGHARSEGMPDLLWVLVSAHVLFAGFWFVAPLTLWPRQGHNRPDVSRRLHAFSRIAIYAVPVMIVAGLWLALIIADGPTGLLGSTYGRLLLLKLVVITAALALGAYNKFRLMQPIDAGEAGAFVHLRRSLSLEFTLFLAALITIAAATTLFGPHS